MGKSARNHWSLVLSQSGKDSVRFSFNFLGWFSFRFRKIHMHTRRCITNVKATGFIAVAIQISQIYNERWVGWVLSESFLIKVAMIGFLSPPLLWQIDRPVEGCVLFPCKRNQWIMSLNGTRPDKKSLACVWKWDVTTPCWTRMFTI